MPDAKCVAQWYGHVPAAEKVTVRAMPALAPGIGFPGGSERELDGAAPARRGCVANDPVKVTLCPAEMSRQGGEHTRAEPNQTSYPTLGVGGVRATARSSAWSPRSTVSSSQARPMSWSPIGSAAESVATGAVPAGRPVRLPMNV